MSADGQASHAAAFITAADLLDAAETDSVPHSDLLHQLDVVSCAPAARADLAQLLRVGAGFRRVFTLSSQRAPGIVAVGAECAVPGNAAKLGVSGIGFTLREALTACIGEGVELLSQFGGANDCVSMRADQALADAGPAMRALWDYLGPYRVGVPEEQCDWVAGTCIGDGARRWLPADLCLRRPPGQQQVAPPWPLSIGCGAGHDRDAAALHGLLELVERDAVARWWRGEQPPRQLAAGSEAARIADATLARLREGAAGPARTSWLLDITGEPGIPAIAAVSCDPNGLGVCFGFAARSSLAAAARGALLELAQMELAHEVVMAKRAERGEDAWNEADRRHADRYARLDAARCTVLRPLPPRATMASLPPCDDAALLALLAARLANAGVEVCAVDLTHLEYGVAVMRVAAPGLQPHPDAPPVPSPLARPVPVPLRPYCHRDIPLL
jgi:ribosomal protein S12 methylthiotransferase accessory factor